jgi:hypothetical protein
VIRYCDSKSFERLTIDMATYDLSKTIIPYLDRHLVFPLLAHLEEIFPKTEVYTAQYELARGTNMFDYAVSLFRKISRQGGTTRCAIMTGI